MSMDLIRDLLTEYSVALTTTLKYLKDENAPYSIFSSIIYHNLESYISFINPLGVKQPCIECTN